MTVTADELRARIVRFAVEEEGNRDASRYWRLVLPNWKGPYPQHWCGAFALVSIQQGTGTSWIWQVKGINGNNYGFLFRLQPTNDPKPGDVAYKNKHQHHAIVVEPDGDYVITADGNSSNEKPTKVTTNNRSLKSAWTFYSIEPYIQDAVKRGLDSDDI